MADIIPPMKNREQHRSKPFFPIAATTRIGHPSPSPPLPARLGRRVAKTGSNVIGFFPDFIVRIRWAPVPWF